ncbi:MAG: PHP domain-containing protein, partial [Desulfobacterales bacterium]
PAIIQRLNHLGFDLALDEVRKEAGRGQLGRPHIASVLVKKGFVQSVDEAFDTLLGNGQPAYVDKFRIDCDRAIEIIRRAGGIPVLAHPGLLNIADDQRFEDLISRLKAMGMMGIEVFYPEHSSCQIRKYAELAERYGLLMTGGTDFHGSLNPEIEMGTGKGDLHIPYELYEKLIRND